MSLPRPGPGILDIAPYQGGEASAPAVTNRLGRLIRLASNESARGPSEQAIAACRALTPDAHRYPDGHARALRQAIGAHHGLDPARITCGAGSDELLILLGRAYAGPGDEVLLSAHGFALYPIIAQSAGARPVIVAERDLAIDVPAMLAAVTDRTRVCFIANPNNPTGTWLRRDDLRRLREGLPEHVLLVLDAAYAEFMETPDYEAGAGLADEFPNVVMTRTFSKLYALAGLRLGWAYGPAAIIDVLNRVRGPFNTPAMAQAAGIAALSDARHIEQSRRGNALVRDSFTAALRGHGLDVPDSAGNFVIPDFGSAERARAAQDFLRNQGVLVRQMGGYGLPTRLRITIGLPDEAAECARLLGEFLAPGR